MFKSFSREHYFRFQRKLVFMWLASGDMEMENGQWDSSLCNAFIIIFRFSFHVLNWALEILLTITINEGFSRLNLHISSQCNGKYTWWVCWRCHLSSTIFCCHIKTKHKLPSSMNVEWISFTKKCSLFIYPRTFYVSEQKAFICFSFCWKSMLKREIQKKNVRACCSYQLFISTRNSFI